VANWLSYYATRLWELDNRKLNGKAGAFLTEYQPGKTLIKTWGKYWFWSDFKVSN